MKFPPSSSQIQNEMLFAQLDVFGLARTTYIPDKTSDCERYTSAIFFHGGTGRSLSYLQRLVTASVKDQALMIHLSEP